MGQGNYTCPMLTPYMRRFRGCMLIIDFFLVLLEFLGLSLGILLIVMVFVSIFELIDLISICYLSKKNKKNNNDKESEKL